MQADYATILQWIYLFNSLALAQLALRQLGRRRKARQLEQRFRAAQTARELGATVVALTGPSGSPLQSLCQHAITVPHPDSDRIQEAHQLTYHVLCDLIERQFADRGGSPAGAGSAGS